MASDNELLIKVSAKTDKATREIAKLSKQVSVLTKETDRNKKSLKNQKVSLDNISGSAKNVNDAFKKVTFGLGALGVAIKGIEFVKMAQDAQQSTDAFNKIVSDMGGHAQSVFDDIKKASKGLISDKEIKQSSVTALSLGVPLEKLAQLMEVARAKSREMGTDVKSAFSDLAIGIGRGSPMILDNLGLTIKLGDANKKMANSLGKSVSALTKQEKILALSNAVIEAGAKSVDRYAKSSLTSKEKTQKFEASLNSLKEKIGNELLPEVTKLTESVTAWIDSLNEDSIKKFGDGISGLFATLEKLVNIVGDLNDLAMPDWLGGDNSGLIGTTLEGYGKLITLFSKASDVLKNLSISDKLSSDVDKTSSHVESLTNAISLLEIGAKNSVNGLSLHGEGLQKLREEYKKNAKSLEVALSENLKLQDFFKNDKSKERGAKQLLKLREEQTKIEQSTKELGSAYATVFANEVPKSIEKSSEIVKKLSQEQQKAIDKINKDRVKSSEKTVKSLLKNESTLTKDILELNKKLASEIQSIEQSRFELNKDIESKIADLKRGSLNDSAAYSDKQLAAEQALSDAKIALKNGDLEKYKYFINQYESLVTDSAGQEIKIGEKVAVTKEETRNRAIAGLENIKQLENEYYNKKLSDAQTAHDREVEYKKIEIDLVRLNIEAQKELIQISSQPKGVPIDTVALDNVLAKIDGLKTGLNSINKTPMEIKADTKKIDKASDKLQEIQKLSINGVDLKVDANTTPLDFGIKKIITKTENDNITIGINPEYTEALVKIDEFRKKANSQKVETTVTADTAQAQRAIDKLKQPTSSIHTIHQKIVHDRAGGGIIPQKLAVGGTFVGSGKVPGYDTTDSDKVNANLTGGEYVINRRAVDNIGTGILDSINAMQVPKFAKGGSVGSSTSSTPSKNFGTLNLNIGGNSYPALVPEEVAIALEKYIQSEGGL